MAQNDWVKLTIRLRPETHYLMNKHCKSEPAVVIRSMIEKWVQRLVEISKKEQEIRADGGRCASGRESDSEC